MIDETAVTAHPLTWPAGWERTKFRTSARFTRDKRPLNVAEGAARVVHQLEQMGVRESSVVVSTNVRPRLDGRPAGGESEPADPGVAIYWQAKTGRRCIAVDMYTRVADNLAAVAATLEAMRAIKRHGGAQILERAFTGFKALPAPEQWWQILGLTGDGASEAEIEAAYLKLAKVHHPDVGGESWQMARINDARDRGLAHVRAKY